MSKGIEIDKNQQIKRNHHYVWSFYLKNWAQGNDIYYISKKGKVACDNVRGLAKETDFYKINPLNVKDIEFIKRISSRSPQSLQDIHMLYLNDFIKLSNISNIISKLKQPSDEVKLVDKNIRHNSLEDLHSIFEDLSVDVISLLAKGNVSILNSKHNMMSFCSYLGHQISRTKAFKDNSLNAIKSNPRINEDYDFYIKLWEKNWWFMSFMFGLNIGKSLYEKNVSSDYNHLSNLVTSNDVVQLNQLILNKSYKTIFASSDIIIRNVKTHNKTQEPI